MDVVKRILKIDTSIAEERSIFKNLEDWIQFPSLPEEINR
jgi:hypothetical protein